MKKGGKKWNDFKNNLRNYAETIQQRKLNVILKWTKKFTSYPILSLYKL